MEFNNTSEPYPCFNNPILVPKLHIETFTFDWVIVCLVGQQVEGILLFIIDYFEYISIVA